MTPGVWLTGRV